jgi:hypothetical protein
VRLDRLEIERETTPKVLTWVGTRVGKVEKAATGRFSNWRHANCRLHQLRGQQEVTAIAGLTLRPLNFPLKLRRTVPGRLSAVDRSTSQESCSLRRSSLSDSPPLAAEWARAEFAERIFLPVHAREFAMVVAQEPGAGCQLREHAAHAVRPSTAL